MVNGENFADLKKLFDNTCAAAVLVGRDRPRAQLVQGLAINKTAITTSVTESWKINLARRQPFPTLFMGPLTIVYSIPRSNHEISKLIYPILNFQRSISCRDDDRDITDLYQLI